MLGMSSHEEYHFFIIIPYRGRMGKRGTCFFRDAMAVRAGGGCSDRDAGEQTRKLAVSHRRNHWLSTLPDVRVPGNGSHHRCVAALLCAMTVGLILVSALYLWAFVRARHVLPLFGRPVGLTITLPRWCRRRGPGTSRPWVFRRASVDSRIPTFSGELARPLTTGPPLWQARHARAPQPPRVTVRHARIHVESDRRTCPAHHCPTDLTCTLAVRGLRCRRGRVRGLVLLLPSGASGSKSSCAWSCSRGRRQACDE